MRVPTVRVANPAAPGTFMTINEEDLGDDHVLWPDQARTDASEAGSAPVDEEAEAAMRMIGKLMARKVGMSADDWHCLPKPERLSQMRVAEAEFDAATVVENDAAPRALPSADAPQGPARVAKGPGGRWYGFRDGQRVTKAFATSEEAQAALDAEEAA